MATLLKTQEIICTGVGEPCLSLCGLNLTWLESVTPESRARFSSKYAASAGSITPD